MRLHLDRDTTDKSILPYRYTIVHAAACHVSSKIKPLLVTSCVTIQSDQYYCTGRFLPNTRHHAVDEQR
jgi:hypothetical protein